MERVQSSFRRKQNPDKFGKATRHFREYKNHKHKRNYYNDVLHDLLPPFHVNSASTTSRGTNQPSSGTISPDKTFSLNSFTFTVGDFCFFDFRRRVQIFAIRFFFFMIHLPFFLENHSLQSRSYYIWLKSDAVRIFVLNRFYEEIQAECLRFGYS